MIEYRRLSQLSVEVERAHYRVTIATEKIAAELITEHHQHVDSARRPKSYTDPTDELLSQYALTTAGLTPEPSEG